MHSRAHQDTRASTQNEGINEEEHASVTKKAFETTRPTRITHRSSGKTMKKLTIRSCAGPETVERYTTEVHFSQRGVFGCMVNQSTLTVVVARLYAYVRAVQV